VNSLKKIPPWLWLIGLASVLRFINLGAESLWYDEAFTAWVSRLNWAKFWPALRGDTHPPLWYLIEWTNVRILGDSEFALRVPSALFGVLIVLLVWRIAVRLHFQPRTAFLAGLLAATLPAGLYYSQDARMYPLLTCCVLWAALSAIEDNWLLFALASVGAVYSHNLGLLYVAAMGIAVAIPRIRMWRTLVRPALAGVGVVLGWLPWAGVALHQAQNVGAGYWVPKLSLGGFFWPFLGMTAGWRIPDLFQIHVYVAVAGLTVIGLIASRKWLISRDGLIVLAVAFGMPVLTAGLSLTWKSVYLHRTMLPSATMLVLYWAYSLNHLSKPNQAVAKAIVVPALLIGLVAHYFPAQYRQSQQPLTEPILTTWQPGDVVYFMAIDGAVLDGYYVRPLPYALFPEDTHLRQSLTAETKAAMGLREVPFDALAGLGYRRAWLVTIQHPLTSSSEIAEQKRILSRFLCAPLYQSTKGTVTTTLHLVFLL
jgi:4-amino-4-deoxy-L-arabinose transferase-like glycosyltransferase